MQDKIKTKADIKRIRHPLLKKACIGNNRYGVKINDQWTSTSASCHIHFQNTFEFGKRKDFEALFISAPYEPSSVVKNHSMYMEYNADPELSPWRDLLQVIDYNVIVDEYDTLIGIQINTFDVNATVLFHWMKSFRQSLEKRYLDYFSDAVKQGLEGDDLLKAWYLSSVLEKYNKNRFFYRSGHQHLVMYHLLNKNFMQKKIIADLNSKKWVTDDVDYTQDGMGKTTFGMQPFDAWFCRELNKMDNSDAEVLSGNIFIRKFIPSNQTQPYFALKNKTLDFLIKPFEVNLNKGKNNVKSVKAS